MGDERRRVVHESGGRVLTKQSHALATDINHILKRYIAHGLVPSDGRNPEYGDFSDSVSYHEAMTRVVNAQQSFDRLPAHIRAYCRNDPGRFLDLVSDPENRGKLEELGLVPSQVPKALAEAEAEAQNEGSEESTVG